jgi:hypothetical protein
MHAKHMWAPACLLSAAALAMFAVPAGAAKKSQLKFFSRNVSASVTDPSGNPPSGRGPAAGDKLVVTDLNFAGNHKHHARRYTSTDHLVCTFSGPATAVCDGQFTIGPSMLLSENVTVDLSGKQVTFPITGGTGEYRGAKGTIVNTSIAGSANGDVVIKLG